MNFFDLNEAKKLNNPYYKIMDLNETELTIELNKWTRMELLDWLKWNDANGVYYDVECMREFGEIISKNEAIEIITNQIINC